MSLIQYRFLSCDQMSETAFRTVSVLEVVKPDRQKRNSGGWRQLKGRASKVMSRADHMRCSRIMFFVSSDIL